MMKSPLKILLGIAAAVLVLFLVVALAVALLVKPEDLRALIVDAVERNTGRSLTLSDDLGLEFLPCCSVALGPATLGNPAGFPADHFARFDAASLRLKIWPLLTRRTVQIGKVTLDGLDLQLLRLADGRANWSFGDATPAADDRAPDAGGPQVERLAIEGVSVRRGRVRYQDLGTGAVHVVTDLGLETGAVGADEPFALELGFAYQGEDGDLAAEVDLTSVLVVGRDGVVLQNPRLAVVAAGAALPAGRAAVTAGASNIDLALGDVNALVATAVELVFDLKTLSAVEGDLAGRANLARLHLDLDTLAGSIAELTGDLQLQDLRATLSGGGPFGGATTDLRGEFELAPSSLRSLLEAGEGGYQPASRDALTRVAGRGQWQFGQGAVRLDALDVQLDETRLTGSLRIEDLQTLATRFDLVLDRLDLDDYLEAPGEAPGEVPGESAAREDGDETLSTAALKTLDLAGRLSAQALTVRKLNLENVIVNVRAADGVLRLDPVSADLYGGAYRGAITIDATATDTQLTLDQQLERVQAGELLGALFDSDRLAGALSLRLTGSGQGSTRTALLKDLVGDYSLGLTDGAYRGMDIVHEFQRARALFRRETPPVPPASQETPIRALSLSGQVRDGVLGSDRLVAEIPYMQLSGKGGLDLVALTLDYRLNAEVRAAGADDGKLGDLAGSIIPFTIRGPVTAPRVRIDLKDMVTTTVRQRAEDRLRSELLRRFGGRSEEAPAAGETDGAPATESGATPDATDQAPTEERGASPEDLLKRGLRDLLKR